MGARHENLRTPGLFAHVDDIGANPIAIVKVFARNAFVPAQQGLGTAKVYDHVAVFDALHKTVDDLAYPVLVFVVLASTFGFTDFLNDNLLGGLRGDPAEIDGRQRIDQKLAQGGVFLLVPRGLEVGLRQLILDLFHILHHFHIASQRNGAGRTVDVGANVMFVAIFGSTRLLDRLFHGFENLITLNALVASHRFRHLQKFRAGVESFRFHRSFAHDLNFPMLTVSRPEPSAFRP